MQFKFEYILQLCCKYQKMPTQSSLLQHEETESLLLMTLKEYIGDTDAILLQIKEDDPLFREMQNKKTMCELLINKFQKIEPLLKWNVPQPPKKKNGLSPSHT